MMKNTIKTMLGLGLALAPFASAQTAPAPAPTPAAEDAQLTPEEIREGVSYYIGFGIGREVMDSSPMLTPKDFDHQALGRGIQDAFRGEVDPAMREKALVCMQLFAQQVREREAKAAEAKVKAAEENKAKGEAFLAENAKKDGVVKTASGLQYKILKDAKGRKYDEAKDGPNAVCSVIYEGRLIDGTVFDSSTEPVPFPINRVIPGFTEALKMMPIGAEWEVYIPSGIAYGENDMGPIPANSTLIFKIKVTDIKPGAPERPRRGRHQQPTELPAELLQQMQEQDLAPKGGK